MNDKWYEAIESRPLGYVRFPISKVTGWPGVGMEYGLPPTEVEMRRKDVVWLVKIGVSEFLYLDGDDPFVPDHIEVPDNGSLRRELVKLLKLEKEN